MTALWTVGNITVRGPIPPSDLPGGEQPSHAYLCPHCGNVWARVAIEGRRWIAVHVVCEPCKPHAISLDAPGSLMLPMQYSWNAAIPRELLLREFNLALEGFK
jgi:hypothetical protein